MSQEVHKDWLPIPLPQNVRILEQMLVFETRWGEPEMCKAIARQMEIVVGWVSANPKTPNTNVIPPTTPFET